MTEIILAGPLDVEFVCLIDRLSGPVFCGDGLTPEETRDLRLWLRAARRLHNREVREAGLSRTPTGAKIIPIRAADRPCDTEQAP